MRCRVVLSLFGLSLVGATSLAVDAPEPPAMTLVGEDLPPAIQRNGDTGEIYGSSTDLLRLTFEKANVPYILKLYPWARAYDMALKDNNTCAYNMARTDDRETLFKFIGPILTTTWSLYGRTDSQPLHTVEEAKSKIIGGYFGDAETNYLKAHGYEVDEARDWALNLQKLMSHRIDYWAIDAHTGSFLTHRPEGRGLKLILRFKQIEVDLACNKSVPDALVEKLNSAIRTLTENGTAAAIRKKYE